MTHSPTDSSRYDCPPDDYWGEDETITGDYEDRDIQVAEWMERWKRACLERSLKPLGRK